MLTEYGCHEIVLIQPEKRSKKKTDSRDANALGELLWVNRDRFADGKKPHNIRRVILPSARYCQDRQLTTTRKRLAGVRTRTINKVHHILRKHNLEQECPTKGLANYWGLTPGCRNSGDVTDRLGSITKQGSALARFILAQMVLHVLRRDPAMRAWYRKIKKRRGAKIARVAVMRRLAEGQSDVPLGLGVGSRASS